MMYPSRRSEGAQAPDNHDDPVRLHRPSVERSPLPTLLTVTEEHTIRHANPAFCALVGRPPGALVGARVPDLFRRAEALEALLERVYRDGVTDVAADVALACREGKAFHGTAIVAPLLDERACQRGLIVQILDTTEQVAARAREAQAARELSEAGERVRELELVREQCLSLITHDLRSSMAAAMYSAEIVMMSRAAGDPQALAGRIVRCLGRMNEMIRTLTDVQRLHAGERLPLLLGACDLVAIAREVTDELAFFHEQRIDLRGEARVEGIWGAEELRRAIGSLASNALRYGETGAPVVVAVERTSDGAAVAVHNQGSPIPAEEQARLLAPRARSAGDRQGLGLTFVHGCAEAHGGRVTLESSAERGTTFTLELPLDSRPYQEPG
ncbi:PAS domain-containing sensor histidine kinase [Sorangium sp. So ce406]|uniref:PAS domain-containing sensor histidine kinase n=1 Tax=Sorangium sp. So ce406 TaxID=3133311 RepID=UPI003F5C54BE